MSTNLYKFILIILLVSCTNTEQTPTATSTLIITLQPEQMDKSPFTGVPCSAPCWYGLEVGKSTESEVTSILPSLTFIDQESLQIYRRPSVPDYYSKLSGPGAEIVANCINSSRECLTITISNNLLQNIIVGLNYEITPDDAIEYLGNPDYIGYVNLGSERVMCEVYLIWNISRLVLASRFEDPEGVDRYCFVVRSEGKVPESLLISEVRYLSQVELNTSLSPGTGKVFEFTGTISDE